MAYGRTKRHQETRRYDNRTGAQTSLTGPNGLTTHWAVDGFGRKDSETRADGSITRYYHKQYSDGSHPAISTVTFADSFMGSQRIAVPTLVFADDSGRQMGSLHWSYVLNGQQPPQPVTRRVHTRQTYDTRGRADTT